MCNSCVPRKKAGEVHSSMNEGNPDLPQGRVIDYRIAIPTEVFSLPLDEYMGYISRTLDRQWSTLYDSAKEEYVRHNKGLEDPTEFTKP